MVDSGFTAGMPLNRAGSGMRRPASGGVKHREGVQFRDVFHRSAVKTLRVKPSILLKMIIKYQNQ
jgi:hypothetical protein